jgi:hypothetical protein
MISFYSTETNEHLQSLIDQINEQKENTKKELDELKGKLETILESLEIEDMQDRIQFLLDQLCSDINQVLSIDLKGFIDQLIQDAINRLISEFQDRIDSTTFARILNLMNSIYSRFQAYITEFKFLLNQLLQLTDMSEINAKLNELLLFVKNIGNNLKDYIENVLTDCLTLLKDLLQKIQSSKDVIVEPTKTIKSNVQFLNNDPIIDALLTNPTIQEWIYSRIADDDYVTFQIDSICDPLQQTTTVELRLLHRNRTSHQVFSVPHGDPLFDGVITPTFVPFDESLIQDVFNDFLDQLEASHGSGFTETNSVDLTVFDDLLTTINDTFKVSDVIKTYRVNELANCGVKSAEDDRDFIESVKTENSDSDETNEADETNNTECNELNDDLTNAVTSLVNVGELIARLDYNMFFDEEGNPKEDYKGFDLLRNILDSQGISVDIKALFDYFNDSIPLGLVEISESERKYPTIDEVNVTQSEELLQFGNGSSALVGVNCEETQDRTERKEDVEFPLEEIVSVLNPATETSGDLLTDVLIDIDNYLTDTTAYESVYEEVLRIKEELLLLTKENLYEIKRIKEKFGEIATKTNVIETVTYEQPSINPLADDGLLGMFGSFEKEENVIAFVLLSDCCIEVQFWEFTRDSTDDRNSGYKYSRLDYICLESESNNLMSFELVDGKVTFTLFNELGIPEVFSKFGENVGSGFKTSKYTRLLAVLGNPLNEEHQLMGRTLIDDKRILVTPDLVDEMKQFLLENKSYFYFEGETSGIEIFTKVGLVMGLTTEVVKKFPIARCNHNKIGIGWFVWIDYDPDETLIPLFHFENGETYYWDYEEYDRNWIYVYVDIQSNTAYINGEQHDFSSRITEIFTEGQVIANVHQVFLNDYAMSFLVDHLMDEWIDEELIEEEE